MNARIFVALAGVLLVGAGCAMNETPPEGYRWVEEAWSPCDSFYDLVPIEQELWPPCPSPPPCAPARTFSPPAPPPPPPPPPLPRR